MLLRKHLKVFASRKQIRCEFAYFLSSLLLSSLLLAKNAHDLNMIRYVKYKNRLCSTIYNSFK